MNRLKNKDFLARGKRSFVYTADYGTKRVIVKEKREDSEALGRMENEAFWLKYLNRFGIGPKLFFSGKDFVVMEFIEGERILDWVPEHSPKEIKIVLLDALKQCRKLDELLMSKEEMHHPVKHLLIRKGKVVFIDFERSHKTEHPQNVTQFCQFLTSGKFSLILKKKGIVFSGLRSVLQEYKRDCSVANFKKVRKALDL